MKTLNESAIAYFSNRLHHETDVWDAHEALKNGEQFTFLDVRSREAFARAHAKGATSFPYREMNEETTAWIPKDQPVVVYCFGPACNAGVKGALQLAKLGFQVKEMIGGFEYWVHEEFEVEGTHADNPPLYG